MAFRRKPAPASPTRAAVHDLNELTAQASALINELTITVNEMGKILDTASAPKPRRTGER